MRSRPILLALFILAIPFALLRAENPVFNDLITKGITMSDGTAVKLPRPVLPDGLNEAGQKAAINAAADARSQFDDLVKNSYYAPVVVKVRTAKTLPHDGPAIRTIDLWFVAHGDWDILTSKDFLESAMKTKEEGPSRVVLKSGMLTDQEIAARKFSATVKENYEERFPYATFSLFERVELSATRFSVMTRESDSILAAARLDSRFLADVEYPNQWRPLLRDERAEIKPGKAHPFEHAGGYAKITRLVEPDDGVLVECHIAYEEPNGWFDGVNLVKQKAPVMVQEKVRSFRRKLTLATQEKEGKK